MEDVLCDLVAKRGFNEKVLWIQHVKNRKRTKQQEKEQQMRTSALYLECQERVDTLRADSNTVSSAVASVLADTDMLFTNTIEQTRYDSVLSHFWGRI